MVYPKINLRQFTNTVSIVLVDNWYSNYWYDSYIEYSKNWWAYVPLIGGNINITNIITIRFKVKWYKPWWLWPLRIYQQIWTTPSWFDIVISRDNTIIESALIYVENNKTYYYKSMKID